MGHIVNLDREYRLLQRQLDRTINGAPESPTLTKILRLLFSSEDVGLARKLPYCPTSLDVLSRRLRIPRDRLLDRLGEMARRGLIFDIEHRGKRYFALAPVAIGFFEFTFMRVRGDASVTEVARLFDRYMHEEDRFMRTIFQGQTQISRALVREKSLPEDRHTEVLDWERASRVVQSASAIGVSLCACRHKASHLGKACDRLQHCCLSLNYAADSLIRIGVAKRISKKQALDILEVCQEAGMAQLADNVQRKLSYICNCCGCCCELIQGIRRFDLRGAIITSNWIMQVDAARCQGCGECVDSCPVDAIATVAHCDGEKTRKSAVCDHALCLGCGVCYSACKFGAIAMKPREKRVLVPETVYDRIVAMAIERGKLAELILDRPERLSYRALGRIVGVLERSPPVKAAMAIKPLRSVFLRGVVAAARRYTAEIHDQFE